MRIALHPTKTDQITIDRYWAQFGHRPLLAADTRPRARCPFCSQLLNDVAGRTGHTIGHFAHLPGSAGCPSKEPAGRPYIRLTPLTTDPQWAQWLKSQFLYYWERYYQKLERLIPYLSLQEFLALVAEANRLRIWEYRHLDEWEIPYVFVLMVDFPVANSRMREGKPQRKYWFRFWYDSSVSCLDDLWIRRVGEPVLYRASYPQPKRSGVVPGMESLITFYPIERTDDYLMKPVERPTPDWVRHEIALRLPQLLGL